MRLGYVAFFAIVWATNACGGGSSYQSPAPRPSRSGTSQSIIGRWALVTLIRNGQERPARAGAGAGAVAYYTFDVGGRFRIELGDSLVETGAWSADSTVSPKVFDHIPDADGRPGPYVPGIYAIAGDTLRISILPPNPTHRRPIRFESTAVDSSWLLVFTRAAR